MTLKILLATLLFTPAFAAMDADSAAETPPDAVMTTRDKASNHVLKIDSESVYGAYQDASAGTASGFWLGGDSRLIITNRHVASTDHVAKYYATDAQGNRFELELVYTNPLVDLAYLKPKDETIKQPSTTFEFSTDPDENKTVYMIGNNGGVGIGFQKAHITDITEIVQVRYPLKSFAISLNSKGGSSGSMVFNKAGQIIGVNYAVSDVSAYAIPAEFVLEDLSFLKQGKLPPKNDIGLVFFHVRSKDAQDHYDYPKDFDVAAYNTTFKGAQSRLLTVQSTLAGTPGAEVFKPGDVITHVGNTLVGPDLYRYYNALNQQKDKVKITYVRQGKTHVAEVTLQNLNTTQCAEMIVFGKAIFAPVDQIQSLRTGLKVGSVGLFSNPPGSVFPKVNYDISSTMLGILEMSYHPIHTLDDFEKAIPALLAREKFSYVFSYCAMISLDNRLSTNRQPLSGIATYTPDFHQTPVRLTFNWTTKNWDRKEIGVKKEAIKSAQ